MQRHEERAEGGGAWLAWFSAPPPSKLPVSNPYACPPRYATALTRLKGADHGHAAGHVGQDAQLQLPVIGHHQRLARSHIGAERLAHL